MNSFVIFISVIISVLCVILTSLQHYVFYKYLRRPVKKFEVPLFEDFIPTDETSLSYYSLDDDTILQGLNAVLDPPKTNENSREPVSETEVHNTLQAALAFHISGKIHKAMKLFEHAAAMAPADADVLNKYGEFLEKTQKDIVSADELYFKALTHSPDHPAALINRRRTAQIVDKLDSEMLKTIDGKRDILKEMFSKDSFDNIKKQAYYLHIYHTVGIEGNTMTIDQLKYLLETGQVISGKSIIEHNEVLGLQLAMKYVKLLTRKAFISVNDILGIHRRVMGHVDPVKSGRFRSEKVFIGKHIPPSPEEVPMMMEAYEYWLNSEEAQNMHPVRYAALAHYKLVDIHPFSDGNGRTSRLVMNLILIRAGYPPVMVLKEQREKYYDALNAANLGDVRPFVRFIAQCTIQILDMYMYGTEVRSIEIEEKEIINY
ncbi:protein adenylyltransferase Fic [Coccinella septempunctata]|uniref:protein adenylyltransferase Fic n=1 Tax=Coccinella septempunctata TaxID=41139 RepID=UPI001D075ECE|nr:protein adenylyltransferase Fic [Coccinella septempunctata]